VSVTRPDWGVTVGGGAVHAEAAHSVDGHCFYGHIQWEGAEPVEQGDRIGMLLDLDQGSMSVYSNGAKMGVMRGEGLSGPRCWAVSMVSDCNS